MTLEAAQPKHRYVALDSLRGICACMVALHHFGTQGLISGSAIVQHGYLFVDFFFVLSGFVIGSSYGARLGQGFPVGRFMWLRLGRIYPLHFAVLMGYLAFELIFALFLPGLADRKAFTEGYSPLMLGYSLLLVQIFFGPEASPWNGPSWSIAAEMWTYLIFALLLRFAGRLISPISLVIALAGILVLANMTDRYLVVIHDGALLRCMLGFALGIVAWRIAAAVASVQLAGWSDTLLELGVVAASIALIAFAGSGPLSLAAPALFFVAVLTFSRERGAISRLLHRAPFILVGTLSYAIYMVHTFLQYRFVNGLKLVEKLTGLDLVATIDGIAGVGGSTLFSDAMSLVFLGIVILVAYACYNWIELPGQRFARSRVPAWRPAPSASTLKSSIKRPM